MNNYLQTSEYIYMKLKCGSIHSLSHQPLVPTFVQHTSPSFTCLAEAKNVPQNILLLYTYSFTLGCSLLSLTSIITSMYTCKCIEMNLKGNCHSNYQFSENLMGATLRQTPSKMEGVQCGSCRRQTFFLLQKSVLLLQNSLQIFRRKIDKLPQKPP